MSNSTNNLLKMLNADKGRSFRVMYADDPGSPCIVKQWLSTGCLALDSIMGGGFPVGRIIELYGDTSTGKSLIAAQAVAWVQQSYPDATTLYIDTERAVSLDIMRDIGVDTSRLMYSDPDTIEDVFELMEDVLEHKGDQLCFIVWDSVAATTAQQEKDADYGKPTMGKHALLMSQGLRKFNRLISGHNACALFINQTRQQIGVMFGDDETTFGGKALPFYSSIRIRLKKGRKITHVNGKRKEVIGIYATAQVVKNKVAKPFLEAELPIYFGYGIDDAEASLLYLKSVDCIVTNGGWFTITIGGNEHKFQSAGWGELYDTYYHDISELVMLSGE